MGQRAVLPLRLRSRWGDRRDGIRGPAQRCLLLPLHHWCVAAVLTPRAPLHETALHAQSRRLVRAVGWRRWQSLFLALSLSTAPLRTASLSGSPHSGASAPRLALRLCLGGLNTIAC
eukprot:SAG11_NODE_426_length_9563_cov_7.501479_9_plen_117_part_00